MGTDYEVYMKAYTNQLSSFSTSKYNFCDPCGTICKKG